MIKKEQVISLILEACPSFQQELNRSNDKDLLYVVMGDLARHLLGLYRNGQTREFSALAEVIEQFHLDGDQYVKGLAIIGFLEGIQNVWGRDGEDPELFSPFLLPESRKWWQELNDFWQGKIEHIGDGLQNRNPDGIRQPANGSPKPSV